VTLSIDSEQFSSNERLMRLPLLERKARLEALLAELASVV
jgi:hypothetical protein